MMISRKTILLGTTALAVGLFSISAISVSKILQNEVAQIDPVSLRDTAIAVQYQKQGNWSEAANLLSKAAIGTNAKAQYSYAYQLARGWGVSRDLEAARDFLLKSVSQNFKGRAQAALELGRLYRLSSGPDCQEIAFEWFLKALDWGQIKAHSEIAKSYARALGVPQDIEKAKFHYTAAAINGSPSAALALIQLIYSHTPKSQNHAHAKLALEEFLPIIEDAATKGNARAARSLARLYEKNGILTADLNKALYWYEKAVSAGDRAAMHDLAMLAIETSDKKISQKKILKLLRASAELGYAGAFTALGRLHLNQQFELKKEDAVAWFTKGVEAGHAGSMEELARLFFEGAIVSTDSDMALNLAEQGAKLKHEGSLSLLSDIKKATAQKSMHLNPNTHPNTQTKKEG